MALHLSLVSQQVSKTKYASGAFIVILFMSMLAPGFSSQLSQISVPSNGLINYPPPPKLEAVFGWGGFIKTYQSVVPLLDQLKQDGWKGVRYQSVPEWAQPTWGTVDINHNILRHLVDEAKTRHMYVMLNIAHNFYMYGSPPEGTPGFYIDGHRDEWINQFIIDATPYKNDDNVILEIANEYGASRESHQAEIEDHYNAMISALRSEGFNQTIQCNFWWNQRIVALNDPLDEYMVGAHYYGQAFDNYNPSTPIDFEAACEESGVNDAIEYIFSGFVADAETLGIPFCTTELGASWKYSDETIPGGYIYSVGGIAYVMQFLEYAKEYNVSVIMHRIGSYSDYEVYYEKALEYFNRDFWTLP